MKNGRMMLLAALVGVVLFGGALVAQEKSKGQLPANYGKLGLSDDQKAQIYKVQSEYTGKIKDLEGQLDKLKKERTQSINKVLTAKQKEQLKEIILGEKAGDVKDDAKK
jgi:hypothetical protein